jgi:FAD/FMN-containing dehydrogenase
MDLSALIKDLEGLELETDASVLRRKSRDYFWYSPVLKRLLQNVMGDLVVCPRNETEVVRVLRACHAHRVPVTPRGAGTGNYGQAMPLSGGVVLDLHRMSSIASPGGSRVVAGPGAVVAAVDTALRKAAGQALRIAPSTAATATVGGFVAGGSGGLGSVRWGGLRAAGNVLGARVVTCEAEPRVLELRGDDVMKVIHAYGTTGVVTELELATTEAHDWIDVLIALEHWTDAARLAQQFAESDGLLLNELAFFAAPLPHDAFTAFQPAFRREQSLVILMAAPSALQAVQAMAHRAGGEVVYRADQVSPGVRANLPPVVELGWNHTTLRALRLDRRITYLQTRYPDLPALERVRARLGDELPMHVELMRSNGAPSMGGLPLVRFTTEQRLQEIMQIHEDEGCAVFNPHVYTLEEGGWRRPDPLLLDFKRQADPLGLLNPGKMVAWERPDFDFGSGRSFVFPGLRGVEAAA